MRFSFDSRKSKRLRTNARRGIGFEEVQELFSRPYWLDQRSDVPEQYLAIGWEGERLYSVFFEFREDQEGEILHLVTLWKSTKEEIRLYEENSQIRQPGFRRRHCASGGPRQRRFPFFQGPGPDGSAN